MQTEIFSRVSLKKLFLSFFPKSRIYLPSNPNRDDKERQTFNSPDQVACVTESPFFSSFLLLLYLRCMKKGRQRTYLCIETLQRRRLLREVHEIRQFVFSLSFLYILFLSFSWGFGADTEVVPIDSTSSVVSWESEVGTCFRSIIWRRNFSLCKYQEIIKALIIIEARTQFSLNVSSA